MLSVESPLLDHGARRDIFRYLADHAGASVKRLAEDLGLTLTNALWHLRALEDAGMVRSSRFHGLRLYYPSAGGVEARRETLARAVLANARTRAILHHVATFPAQGQREAARMLGVNHGTVRWHLRKLVETGLVEEARVGRASQYRPTAAGEAALKETTPGAPCPSENVYIADARDEAWDPA